MCEKVKWMASALLIVGLSLIGYSGYQLWDSNKEQADALQRAHQIIEKSQVNIEQIEMDIDQSENMIFEPNVGDEIGLMILPKIDATLPIIEGVDEDELKKGVGHYGGTAFPSQDDQIVLSGHRDTVFRRMGELEIGDEIIVKMPYGDFTYIIEETEIVDADDLTVIRSDYNEEILTVTTCYPFRYVGNAPDRYIIYAKPTDQTL